LYTFFEIKLIKIGEVITRREELLEKMSPR